MSRGLSSVGTVVHTRAEMAMEAAKDFGASPSFVAPTSKGKGVRSVEQKGVRTYAESSGGAESRKILPSVDVSFRIRAL